MKLSHLALAAALTLAGTAFAGGDHDHAHEHEALHGGVVVEVKDIDYELVATPSAIQLHLRDHGRPADVSKLRAKLTLLAGTEKQEVELAPSGDRLAASGSFRVGAGTKAVAVITGGATPATVRFALK